MLKIKVNGRPLILSRDLKINLTIENPFMLTERVPVPYSLTFELPATPENLLALKYPNRITSKGAFAEYSCEISFNEIIFLKGTLAVTEFNETIQAGFKGVSFNDYVRSNLHQVPMQQYDFGIGHGAFVNYNQEGHWSNNYKNLIQQSIQGSGLFVSAPIRIKDVDFDSGMIGGTVESGVLLAHKMYLSFFNAKAKNFLLTSAGFSEPSHTHVYPMPYVHYVLDVIFGDILENNPFAVGELAKMVLVSPFHEVLGYPTVLTDNNFGALPPIIYQGGLPWWVPTEDDAPKEPVYLKLNSFLPATPANDFLKELLKITCSTLIPYAGKVRLVHNKDILNSTEVENWTSKLIGRLGNSLERGKVYNYGYDGVKEGTPMGGFVYDNIFQLVAAPASEGDGTNYSITNTNQVINKKLVNGGEVEYRVIRNGLGGIDSPGANSFDMKSAVVPLPMNIHKYWWDIQKEPKVDKGDWYVPEIEMSRTERPTRAHVMLYQGMADSLTGAGDRYPLLTPHNYDHLGNRLGDFSLSWDGPDGLMATYHAEFRAWVEKDKVRTPGTFLLSALELKNLDITTRKNVNGMNFFIERINLTIEYDKINPAQIDLIEA